MLNSLDMAGAQMMSQLLSVNTACLPDVKGVQAVESLRNMKMGYHGQEAVVEHPALQTAQPTRYAMQTRALKISGRVSGDTLDRSSCIKSALVPRNELMNCSTHAAVV